MCSSTQSHFEPRASDWGEVEPALVLLVLTSLVCSTLGDDDSHDRPAPCRAVGPRLGPPAAPRSAAHGPRSLARLAPRRPFADLAVAPHPHHPPSPGTPSRPGPPQALQGLGQGHPHRHRRGVAGRPAARRQPPPRHPSPDQRQPHRRASRRTRAPRGPGRPGVDPSLGQVAPPRAALVPLQPVQRSEILPHVPQGALPFARAASETATDGMHL